MGGGFPPSKNFCYPNHSPLNHPKISNRKFQKGKVGKNSKTDFFPGALLLYSLSAVIMWPWHSHLGKTRIKELGKCPWFRLRRRFEDLRYMLVPRRTNFWWMTSITCNWRGNGILNTFLVENSGGWWNELIIIHSPALFTVLVIRSLTFQR